MDYSENSSIDKSSVQEIGKMLYLMADTHKEKSKSDAFYWISTTNNY